MNRAWMSCLSVKSLNWERRARIDLHNGRTSYIFRFWRRVTMRSIVSVEVVHKFEMSLYSGEELEVVRRLGAQTGMAVSVTAR